MGKRQKVTADNLSEVLAGVIEDYVDGVSEGLNKSIHRVALDGVKALKSNSNEKVKLTGKYAKGWRTKSRTDKVTGQSETLYNAAKPGLTHLLEYGHANRDGSRTPGIEHIRPIEQEVIAAVTAMIKDEI